MTNEKRMMDAVGIFLHTIDTWKESDLHPPAKSAGYKLALIELRHLPELDEVRAAHKEAGETAKRACQQNRKIIREIWAWMVRSSDGSEGVAAVAPSRESLELSKQKAIDGAAILHASIGVARFVRSEP